MPRVQIRIHHMSNGKVEISCKAVRQPHSRPYDTTAEAKAVLLRLGVPEEVADPYLAQLRESEWIDVGEYETEETALREMGFTAVS
jgi:hypothetical protein